MTIASQRVGNRAIQEQIFYIIEIKLYTSEPDYYVRMLIIISKVTIKKIS